MITRCDQCGSTFEVSTELLNSGDPSVRCGECTSLFDARANLYDEADFLKASGRLKPVQRTLSSARKSAAIHSEFLETAETVAVEHVYTAAGVVASTSGGSSSHKDLVKESDFNAQPDIDLARSSISSQGHRADNRYTQDFEFERTVATESAHANLTADADYRDRRRPIRDQPPRDSYARDKHGRGNNSRDSHRGATTAEQEARGKQQLMREREQRALGIEPERDFKSTEAAGNNNEIWHIDNQTTTGRRSINDSDLARDVGVSARGDHAFIPDDVLTEPAVHRDNGRRDTDLQFGAETPRFATSPQDSRNQVTRPANSRAPTTGKSANAVENLPEDRVHDRGRSEARQPLRAVRKETRPANRASSAASGRRPEVRNSDAGTSHREPERRPAAQTRRDSDRIDAVHSSEFQHLNDDAADFAVRDEQLQIAGSSAQEMRRYQHYRPAVDVAVAPDVTEEHAAGRRQGLAVKPVLWFVGLCAAVCLLLFLARNQIANMDLPEPLIAGFCQVTGCVPADAKKDVTQLQTMRQNLYSHPEIEEALVISADVINNSVYKQPYPTLTVTLLDANGGTIAERAFESTDYEVVDGGEAGFLMPGEPTRLKIEIVDTGLNAEEMELAFE